jgi:hypothetical protein
MDQGGLFTCAFGAKADLDTLEADITTSFKTKAEPVFNEYVGNKIDINRCGDCIATIKFTQPFLIQKLEENHTPIMSCAPKTPAVPGSNLCNGAFLQGKFQNSEEMYMEVPEASAWP